MHYIDMHATLTTISEHYDGRWVATMHYGTASRIIFVTPSIDQAIRWTNVEYELRTCVGHMWAKPTNKYTT